MPEDQEKTQEPTPRKLEEARAEGQVARSQELPIALGLLAAVLSLRFGAEGLVRNLQRAIQYYMQILGDWVQSDLTLARITDLAGLSVRFFFLFLAPLFLALLVVGIFAHLIQTGPLFTLRPLRPRLDRIRLISGLKTLFSQRSIVEAVKSLLKVAAVGAFAAWLLYRQMPEILLLPLSGPEVVLPFMGALVYRLALVLAIAFTVLALLDYAYQRWRHHQSMKMSVEEVKEETKQYEGDPLVKARIRSIQRQLARRRMMKEVPEATVVITNPHEIAVALKYRRETMPAPQVVAKGQRLIAQKIKQIAREHHVPIVEDRPLARSLYRDIPLGAYITSDYYKAVAEILAYLYRLRRPAPHTRPRMAPGPAAARPVAGEQASERQADVSG
ncbi:MAG: flagellar biosynthesis protein FlhB [Candidatus Poribacteria bacterium]|nr:MAG: flagellar biosynthesis protein FlhB [Candidatus Poribacteria bacterium]